VGVDYLLAAISLVMPASKAASCLGISAAAAKDAALMALYSASVIVLPLSVVWWVPSLAALVRRSAC
jgi:hypothetical protein